MTRVRSALVLAREFPRDPYALKVSGAVVHFTRALVAAGLSVHVLAEALEPSLSIEEGVVVHRLAASEHDPLPEDLDEALWAATVAANYRGLDEQVDFDLVLAASVSSALRLELRHNTALVALLPNLDTNVGPLDARRDPLENVRRALEQLSLRRADFVLAPSENAIVRATSLYGPLPLEVIPVVAPVAPRPSDVTTTAATLTAAPSSKRAIELVFVGPFDAPHAPELAIATVGKLQALGVTAHCTLVGRDTAVGSRNSSYRKVVCRSAMTSAGVSDAEVTFIESLDDDALRHVFSHADFVLAPFAGSSLEPALLEALAAGVPILTIAGHALAEHLSDDVGVLTCSADSVQGYAEDAAAMLAQPEQVELAMQRARAGAAAALTRSFSPTRQVERLLRAVTRQVRTSSVPTAIRQPARHTPSIGMVLRAVGGGATTTRTVASVLHHTDIPLRCVLVGAQRSELPPELLADPRLTVVPLATRPSVAEAYNVGLQELAGDEDYIAFGDSLEVLANWWQPYIATLEANHDAAIVAEEGLCDNGKGTLELAAGRVGEVLPVTTPAGGFFLMPRRSLEQFGRFATGFEGDRAILEYASRTARLKEHVLRICARRVLLLSCQASRLGPRPCDIELSPQQREPGPFVLLADATHATSSEGVLKSFRAAFTRDDAVLLVLYGPGLDQQRFLDALNEVAARADFDLEHGPRLVAMLPSTPDPHHEAGLARDACALFGPPPPIAAFAHLPLLQEDDPAALRLLAARFWRAQSTSLPTPLSRAS